MIATTLFIVASAVPTISIQTSNSGQFTTKGNDIIQMGGYTYDPSSASLSKVEQVDLVDADDFLNDLLLEHNLEEDLPDARRWLAQELYGKSEPTLAALRLKQGLTQAQLASITEQPQSSISRLESGAESPTIDRAARIAEALEVNLDQFYSALTTTRRNREA